MPCCAQGRRSLHEPTTQLPPAAHGEDPEIWRPALQAAVDGATRYRPNAIIVGCARCAGRAERLAAPQGIALVDPLYAAMDEAQGALSLNLHLHE